MRAPAADPPAAAPPAGAVAAHGMPRPGRRALLWLALVAMLVVAQSALVVLTLRHEEARAQERAEDAAALAQGEIRRRMNALQQAVQALPSQVEPDHDWSVAAMALLRRQREVVRLEWRDRELLIRQALDSPLRMPAFADWPRQEMLGDTETACSAARRTMTPAFSRSQFVPMAGGTGNEVVDLCVPVQVGGRWVGFEVATLALPALLEELNLSAVARSHEISVVEPDGTRLARAGSVRGAGVYVAERLVDLPGSALQLRADATERRPSLIPNLATALVLGLSLALFAVVVLLLRDGRRRARAESALAEALAFRKAMEDSLLTGLRARDRHGRIVYVNPAFCAMVGYSADELTSAAVPPYWPPDQVPLYQRRQIERLGTDGSGATGPSREGYETEFVRRSGERIPVMVYEAPLVDGQGRHTGWMSAVLDLSAQRRVEELSRQQQERLQATARLASVGEMASLLSHELNQPLSAIASYATGSLNLLDAPQHDPQLLSMLRHALQRVAEQAERAGRVIKSVHDFVRRRHQAHEVIAADALIESVLPLVRLQARKSGTRVALDIPSPAPRVRVDRTMVEQVLLNLTRNGIQAMEGDTPLARRVLTLRVRPQPVPAGREGDGEAAAPGDALRWVAFQVEDAGPGIPAEVAHQLFTPFFTTKPEGMGLGLSLCRTVVEQHGGALDFSNRPAGAGSGAEADPAGALAGTVFTFTLPAAVTARRRSTPVAPETTAEPGT